jgi:hypothetical protein
MGVNVAIGGAGARLQVLEVERRRPAAAHVGATELILALVGQIVLATMSGSTAR